MERINKQAYQQAKIFLDMLVPLIERFKDVSHYKDSKGGKSLTKWFPKKKSESRKLPPFKEFCAL